MSSTAPVGCTHLLGLPQLDLQGPLHLLVLLPPPLLLLLQQDLCLPLGLLEQLQLLQLPLLFLLQLLEPLRLLLLGRLALLPLLPLLPALLLQVLVQGLLSLCLQPDGSLDGCRGRARSVGTAGGTGKLGKGRGVGTDRASTPGAAACPRRSSRRCGTRSSHRTCTSSHPCLATPAGRAHSTALPHLSPRLHPQEWLSHARGCDVVCSWVFLPS